MSEHLDERLRALNHVPVPPLAPADLVRRRGRQRTVRARAGRAVAGLSLVAAVSGITWVAVAGDDKQALQYAPQPTPTRTADTTTGAEQVGTELLLQPQDAADVGGGSWTAGAAKDQSFTELVVCATKDVGGEAGTTRVLEQGNTAVLNQVVRYPDGRGPEVLALLRDDVRSCPQRPVGSRGGSASFAVDSTTDDTVVVRDTTRDCAGCPAVVTYWVAVAAFSQVSYAHLPATEHLRLGAWADAARFRLVCAAPGCARGTDAGGAEPGPLASADAVRLDGIGPVTIGMTLTEAAAAVGQPLTTFRDDLGNGCGYVAPRSGSPDVSFMVLDGRIARVDVDAGSSTRTSSGVGIGTSEQQAEAAYPGRVVTRKHAYTAGHYLRVTSYDGRLVLVLETDGTRVTKMRTGTRAAADYTEGCA